MNKWAKWLLRFFLRFSAIAYSRRSYSQEGEDLILAGLIGDRPRSFYVDIGAHHPHRFSNTFYFYQRGWRGINVDPMVGMKSIFDKMRLRDINLQLGCAQMEGSASYRHWCFLSFRRRSAG